MGFWANGYNTLIDWLGFNSIENATSILGLGIDNNIIIIFVLIVIFAFILKFIKK